jgi:putative ABC transport system substrate-binding protein
MITRLLLVFFCFILSPIQTAFSATITPPRVTILQIVEHPALNITRQGIIDELANHGIDIIYQSAQGNTQMAMQIAHYFTNTTPNFLVGIGTIATQALIAANRSSNIPIVFSSVTDPKAVGVVQNLKNPEGNITGVSNDYDPLVQFKFFKKIIPSLNKLGIIYNPGETNSVLLLERMKIAARKMNIELILAPANHSAEVPNATRLLLTKTQAIFINNDNTALSAFDTIIKITRHHDVPVFCSDTDMVNRGALAALGPDQYQIGRQTGKLILQILAGKTPNTLAVLFPTKEQIKINYPEAMRLKIDIPAEFLSIKSTS